MIKRYKLFIDAIIYISFGTVSISNAQELLIEKVSISDEGINLIQHPLEPDPEQGISTARLGVGKLYQMDVVLVEIPPRGHTPPTRHLSEEMIYIVGGKGYTTMWNRNGEKPRRYDWSAGDLLSPSLNTWHEHFNASSETPARYVSLSTTPLTKNLFQEQEFIYNSDFKFESRWQKSISQKPEYIGPDSMDMLAGHILPNLPGRELQGARGGWGITVRPQGSMGGNRVLQMNVREYRTDKILGTDIHRHLWEVVYLVLEGKGTSILKRVDGTARLVNWEKGDLFIVEANEYHDNSVRLGSVTIPPYPRLMQVRPSGYFERIGNVEGTDKAPINIYE